MILKFDQIVSVNTNILTNFNKMDYKKAITKKAPHLKVESFLEADI